MTAKMRSDLLTLFIGGMLGLFFSLMLTPLDIGNMLWRGYDMLRPVVTMVATPMELPDGRYALRMSGVKHRGACKLERVLVYSVTRRPYVVRTPLYAERLGGGTSPLPEGHFDSHVRPWIVIPKPTGEIEVWTEHDCDGRAVLTQAEVRNAE